jgi:hypothetical protein
MTMVSDAHENCIQNASGSHIIVAPRADRWMNSIGALVAAV